MNNETIQQLLMSQRVIAGSFSEMANNPAVPEMVRDVFSRASNDLNACINYAEQLPIIDAVRGLGPKSQQLILAAQWLGMGDKVNIAHLPVRTDFYDHNVLFPEEDREKLKFALWSLFLRKFPVERFKTTGKLEPLRLGLTLGDLDAQLEVGLSEGCENQEWDYIRTIRLTYGPREQYWSASVVMDRRSALFHRLAITGNVMVHHDLEVMTYQQSMTSFGYLMNDVMLDKVCELLDIRREELKFGYTRVHELSQVIDVPKIVTAELQSYNLVTDELLHEGYSWLMFNTRHGHQISIPAIDASVVLKPGRPSWTSYDAYLDEQNDYWVKRNETTWLEAHGIRIADISAVTDHRFPLEIVTALEEGIRTSIRTLVAEMLVEWNANPRGAYKEYLENESGSQEEPPIEPAS